MKKLRVWYNLLHMMFWCTYAIVWSYVTVYLTDVGYRSTVVGIVTGVGAVVSVIGQPILAALTQKSRKLNTTGNILIWKAVSIVIAALIMIQLPGWYTIAALFVILLAIDASVPSMLSTVAMECVNEGKVINYGLARGLGSIIYAICSLILGYLVESLGSKILMPLYCGFGILTILVGYFFRKTYRKLEEKDLEHLQNDNQQIETPEENGGMIRIFQTYPFLLPFLLGSVFLFMGHNIVNIFLIDIVERVGGSNSSLGISLAIAAAVELPVMTLFVKLAKRFPIDKLLIFSSIMFIVKTVVTLLAPNLAVIYLAQFLQFGAFALYTPASVYFINQTMKEKDSSVGQAMVGACTLGLGGTLGNILGGILLDHYGVSVMVQSAAILSVIGMILMFFTSFSMNRANRK